MCCLEELSVTEMRLQLNPGEYFNTRSFSDTKFIFCKPQIYVFTYIYFPVTEYNLAINNMLSNITQRRGGADRGAVWVAEKQGRVRLPAVTLNRWYNFKWLTRLPGFLSPRKHREEWWSSFISELSIFATDEELPSCKSIFTFWKQCVYILNRNIR